MNTKRMTDDIPKDLVLLMASYITKPERDIVKWLPRNRHAWLDFVPEHLKTEMLWSWTAYNPTLDLTHAFGMHFPPPVSEIDWLKLLHDPAMFDTLKKTVDEISSELSENKLDKSIFLINYPKIDESYYTSNPRLFEILVEPTRQKMEKKAKEIQTGKKYGCVLL